MGSLSKEQSILSRETTQNAFFPQIMPLFQLGLFILYQAPHSQALAPACRFLSSYQAPHSPALALACSALV